MKKKRNYTKQLNNIKWREELEFCLQKSKNDTILCKEIGASRVSLRNWRVGAFLPSPLSQKMIHIVFNQIKQKENIHA
ncbi:MAG: hypothetical protein RLY43_1319 [Bacteroidota bacterium]